MSTFTFRETAHERYVAAFNAPRRVKGLPADEVHGARARLLAWAAAGIEAARQGPVRRFQFESTDEQLEAMAGWVERERASLPERVSNLDTSPPAAPHRGMIGPRTWTHGDAEDDASWLAGSADPEG